MDKKDIVFSMLFMGLQHCHSDNGKNDIIIIKSRYGEDSEVYNKCCKIRR